MSETALKQSDLNISRFYRYFTSKRNTIPTLQIKALNDQIIEWVEYAHTGAIIYGRPRIGKTRAIEYITRNLKSHYGEYLPVLLLYETKHACTERYFYSEMLALTNDPRYMKGTAQEMRQRLIQRLSTQAAGTSYGKLVLFIDEANLLTLNEYYWLMDLYNWLEKDDVQLSIFLTGQPELKERKKEFILGGQNQIVGRFMVQEYQYTGLCNQLDLLLAAKYLEDSTGFSIDEETNQTINLTETFFPRAFQDEKKLCDTIVDMWNAFQTIQAKRGILKYPDIPMKYFIDSYLYCLSHYGAFSTNPVYLPDEKVWEECIYESHYIDGEDVYSE